MITVAPAAISPAGFFVPADWGWIMARSEATKRKPAPDAKAVDLNASELNANDGRGGHARSQARKTAVKKAFGLLTRKR